MLIKRPLKLLENRVWRLYKGGGILDTFFGKKEMSDGHYPEDWIGSTVIANNSNESPKVEEGLSFIYVKGEKRSLESVLQQNAEELLGREHLSKYGANLGVLIKLLDAAIRLPIQVHPTRELAQKYFNSPYGKTEAWIVLDTRDINGIEPYILLGFREGMSREAFKEIIKNKEFGVVEQYLNRIPIKKGDVYLIEAGIPHAIGPGIFLLEIQEPTDITLRAELNVGDMIIKEEMAFLGLLLEEYLDCFSFNTFNSEDVLKQFKLAPRKIREVEGYGKEYWLIGYEDTLYFAVRSMVIESSLQVNSEKAFHILIVIEGSGTITGLQFSQKIKKGDYFFIPSQLAYEVNNLSNGSLQLMTCWPPKC